MVVGLSAAFSACSILFEDTMRRNEVVYFVSAKAVRSVYLWVKRVLGVSWKSEAGTMHIIIMSLLYYVYIHYPNLLKFRNIFSLILGDD